MSGSLLLGLTEEAMVEIRNQPECCGFVDQEPKAIHLVKRLGFSPAFKVEQPYLFISFAPKQQ